MYSKYILIASFVFACVFARPSDNPAEKEQPTVIPIVSQSDELESNGTYKFSYETGNGIKREEIAYEKVLPKGREASSKEEGENDDESDEIHVQQGSFSYTAPDGTVITLRYIADENGFQPIGDHLPRSPISAPASSNSAEKGGRALKAADSVDSASMTVEAKSIKKPTETVMVADELVKTVPITKDSKMSSSDADPEPANINVSTEVASTASAQSSTEASPASAKQTSTSAPEQSAEVIESSSSTSAPEQSSSAKDIGQSSTTEAVSQSAAKEVQKPTTNATQSAPSKGSNSTTVSA
ncbi:putative protein TPRXL [Nymphalis io]|uniref:putative protein TPRXL n=1 Tax=Inachis io TaxID=171585 RepID=UPI0021685C13|nr:putative protein TPRXL [Nymphalis io]